MSTIKSEKNIFQTIHSTSFILIFFVIFCIFLDFLKIQIPFCEKNTLLHTRLHRPPGAIFEWFGNFPITPTYPLLLENCQTIKKMHLVVCGNADVRGYFFQKIRYFFQKIVKNIKEMEINIFLLKKYALVPKLSYIFLKKFSV